MKTGVRKKLRASPEQCLALASFDGKDARTRGYNAAFALIYGAGLLASEFLSLHWKDVVVRDPGREIVKVKGPRARKIPLPDIVSARLNEYRRALRIVRPSDKISAWKKNMVLLELKSRARRLGYPGSISLLDLRTAFVRHMVQAGTPMQAVFQLLGVKYHETVRKMALDQE
jgi:site-specific recombinase XerC